MSQAAPPPESTTTQRPKPRGWRLIVCDDALFAIRRHVDGDTSVERGGILVGTGDSQSGLVVVVDAVEARSARGEVASLTFTHDTWDEVNDIIDREHAGLSIVGWYHSHPRFGVFLSDHDLFIHKNFFPAPHHVAFVRDPIDGSEGFFGWGNNDIVRVPNWEITKLKVDEHRRIPVGRRPPPASSGISESSEPSPATNTGSSSRAAAPPAGHRSARSRPSGMPRRRLLGLGFVAAGVLSIVVGILVLVAGFPVGAAVASAKQTADQASVSCVAQLDPAVRVGQTLLAVGGDPGTVRADIEAGRLAGYAPTGTITLADAQALKAMAEFPGLGRALIAADEEGGRVQRYRSVLGSLPSATDMAATMTPQQVHDVMVEHGRNLRFWGVRMVFAPVVDVGRGPAIENRAFGDDPETVTTYAKEVATALQEAGVIPVLKHFPGHGSASVDTHLGLASTPPWAEMQRRDVVPYAQILELLGTRAGVMVGHLDVPGLTGGAAASLSKPAITGALRGILGFQGLVVSDALGMGAISVSEGEAAVRFLAAGGDLALVTNGSQREAAAAVRSAADAGRLPWARIDEAAARVLAVKEVDACSLVGGPAPAARPTSSTATVAAVTSVLPSTSSLPASTSSTTAATGSTTATISKELAPATSSIASTTTSAVATTVSESGDEGSGRGDALGWVFVGGGGLLAAVGVGLVRGWPARRDSETSKSIHVEEEG